jgi:hypothetical protein
MLYAILAYHDEAVVEGWTAEEDKAVMEGLSEVHGRLKREKRVGPTARLGSTRDAVTLRVSDKAVVLDGPFAETKEQLLGFYVVDCETRDEAIGMARDLNRANPTAVYEIRPIRLYRPGNPFPETALPA